MSKEFNIIGGLGCFAFLICCLSLIGSATAASDTFYFNTTGGSINVETLGGKDVITPVLHFNDPWFSLYNEDRLTYHVYMYNYSGNNPDNYTDSFIGVVRHGEVMILNKNASYYVYAEYPDEIRLESLTEVKKGVNQYWVIVVVFIVIVIALYTAIRIIRGRKY